MWPLERRCDPAACWVKLVDPYAPRYDQIGDDICQSLLASYSLFMNLCLIMIQCRINNATDFLLAFESVLTNEALEYQIIK